MRSYSAVTDLPEVLAARLAKASSRRLRVAIDGPGVAEPDRIAAEIAVALRAHGRFAATVPAACFWRDASLRLESGRFDPEALRRWLDADALQREVLRPLAADGAGHYLPSLRDPVTNRATRARPVPVPDDAIVLISGSFLLGRGLPFDCTVHLSVGAAARRRRTPANAAWTLPAFDAYDADVDPLRVADVVVRLDDPRRPAVSD